MIIDCHVHLFTDGREQKNLVFLARKNKIDKICICSLGRKGYLAYPALQEVQEANDDVLKLMDEFPEEVIGFCYLNPLHRKNAIKEMHRCVGHGMKGIKLWVACKANNPLVSPIVEEAVRFNVPVLQHALFKVEGAMKDESSPEDAAKLAQKYPSAKIIMAHLWANWEKVAPVIKPFSNLHVDTSGGWPYTGMIEGTVKEIGAKRIVFGSDAPGRSFSVQLAKVLSAEISLKEKNLILSENISRLVGGRNVD